MTAPVADATAPAEPQTGRREGHVGWLEHTIGGITTSIEHAVFTERHARSEGFLQSLDPRAKLTMFLAIILAASLTGSIAVLVALYAIVLAVARVQPPAVGVLRQARLARHPALRGDRDHSGECFIVPGPRLFDVALGPVHVAPSIPGIIGAGIFLMRVGVSVSLAVLLVMTTPWADILKSLRALRVPQVFVLILSMTYRYVFLFLHTVNGMLLARKSRMVAATSGREQRRWIGGAMGAMVGRSFKMSNDISMPP